MPFWINTQCSCNIYNGISNWHGNNILSGEKQILVAPKLNLRLISIFLRDGSFKNSVIFKHFILSSIALAHLYPRRNNPPLASGSWKPELLSVHHGWHRCWTWVSSLLKIKLFVFDIGHIWFLKFCPSTCFYSFSIPICLWDCVFLLEVTLALLDAATDKDSEVQEQVRKSILTLGKQQPDRVLAMCQDYLVKHPKVTT